MDMQSLKLKYGIGLTGGIATGKSTIGRFLRELGYLVIDADILARKIVEKGSVGLAKIEEAFGNTIIETNGSLNRQALAQIVFEKKDDKALDKKALLESITHPLIHKELERELKQSGLFEHPQIWFYEAALLFEVGKDKEFLQVWVTYCDEQTQINRLKIRNNISETTAQKIIASQLSARIKRDRADFVIDTTQDLGCSKNSIEEKLKNLTFG